MKAAIYLSTSQRESKKGFPIEVKLTSGARKIRKTIGHSKIEFWNKVSLEPLKMHPEYNFLMPLILDFKAKIAKVNYGEYSFSEASEILFGEEKKTKRNLLFFDSAIKLYDETTTGDINKTALKSFNSFSPEIEISKITPELVTNYKDWLLEKMGRMEFILT